MSTGWAGAVRVSHWHICSHHRQNSGAFERFLVLCRSAKARPLLARAALLASDGPCRLNPCARAWLQLFGKQSPQNIGLRMVACPTSQVGPCVDRSCQATLSSSPGFSCRLTCLAGMCWASCLGFAGAPHFSAGGTALLLANLGTPRAAIEPTPTPNEPEQRA